MGFYDKKIKQLYESCPRLVILSINSIFHKSHSLDTMVYYLDKEQPAVAEENETFMDMLIQLEDSKYHFEFQLLEDNMAIRMYEYSVKETIRELHHGANQGMHYEDDDRTDCSELSDRYEIEIIMPSQAIIFLAGGNKKQEITVKMTLPDGQKVEYKLPCISASQTVDELMKKGLYILLPFQQVQLNHRMNHKSEAKFETKHRIAQEIYEYHKSVKNGLEKLYEDGIIRIEEYQELMIALSDLENYLGEKDEVVSREVKEMGDKDYIPWSERIRNEALQDGISQGVQGVVIDLLAELGNIPEELMKTIQSETAIDTLKKWHKLATKVESIEEFIQKIS